MRRSARTLAATFAATLALVLSMASPGEPGSATLVDGAAYVIEMPAAWNGTLLLYSHGYSSEEHAVPTDGKNEVATLRPYLLAHGYALAGSSYASGGYAIEDGLRDGIGTLDAFEHRYGKAKRTIAWGHSLGGIISAGLVERNPGRFDGAVPMCGVLAGSNAAWDQIGDAGFAFAALLAPGSKALAVVRIADPQANFDEAERIFKAASQSAQGRARLALAAAFDEIPTWYGETTPESVASDLAARERGTLAWMEMAVLPFTFLLRNELEKRSAGNPSTNAGVSYMREFPSLPTHDFVESLYKLAGLDLAADLASLDRVPRIEADSAARAYLARNIDIGPKLTVPVFTLHTTSDGLSAVQNEAAYRSAVPKAARASLLRQGFIARAGHCAFTAAETLTALQTLESRLARRVWPSVRARDLNASARANENIESSFGVLRFDGGSAAMAPAFSDAFPAPFARSKSL